MKLLATRALAAATALLIAFAAHADVRLAKVFGSHMVLQRDRPVKVWGWADAGEKVTVRFGGQSALATAGADGAWRLELSAMRASARPTEMVVSGRTTITLGDVLVGDVWLCSGQSNMDMSLGGCDRKEDIDSANLPGIRSFRAPGSAAEAPQTDLKGEPRWVVCSPATAGGFSATAFYFARKLHQESKGAVPIGLLVASVGGTSIDLWLAPEGLIDIPTLHPLFGQPVLPGGPFHLFNGMVAPLAPFGIKGAIWYQGENAERTVQSPDSYFLKMKALQQGWKRLWGMDDFPFYYVMIANWGELPADATPVPNSGGWNGDTRVQQALAMALPHAGCASAIDIGDSSMGDKIWAGWHPKDKLDVGERLALWALRNDYGRPATVASGPTLKDVTVSGSRVGCLFNNANGGLMVGTKSWYQPTKEVPGGALRRFSIAGADGKWFPADAVIGPTGNVVVLSSPSVPAPRKIAYAVWQNPEGCNLYNRAGLPANPFLIDGLTERHTITATAGPGGTITPSGANRLLGRMTALYRIQPKPGYFIRDVKVDGKSVGSVTAYTFDPVRTDHTIAATFAKKPPAYTIRTSDNSGGAVTPAGAVSATQGAGRTLRIVPRPRMFTKSLSVDGVAISPRDSFTFSDIRSNHTISASFGCRVTAEAGFGGSVSPSGDVAAAYGDDLTFSIAPLPGYAVSSVMVDGKEAGKAGSYTFRNVTTSHTLSVRFQGAPTGTGAIPRKGDLVFAALSETLPKAGTTAPWPALAPDGATLKPIATPNTVNVAGLPFSRNLYLDGDGFTFRTFAEPIPCNGASIVCVARPMRLAGGSGWFSIVDVFYDRLVLGIRNDSGLACVRRNGSTDDSQAAIPDGQITILSLVVQPDGRYKVWANGSELMSRDEASPMTALAPGEQGYMKSITVGRNAPDVWTTYNGDIGDVFLYRVALSDEERKSLESYLERKLTAG